MNGATVTERDVEREDDEVDEKRNTVKR